MGHERLRKALDVPSMWGLRILSAVSLAVTCALAFSHSKRTAWAALATVLLLLLGAVNRVRISRKLKPAPGTAIRPKRERREVE